MGFFLKQRLVDRCVINDAARVLTEHKAQVYLAFLSLLDQHSAARFPGKFQVNKREGRPQHHQNLHDS